jgi:hypothetical protein
MASSVALTWLFIWASDEALMTQKQNTIEEKNLMKRIIELVQTSYMRLSKRTKFF